MVTKFTRHFLKDLDKINHSSIKREIAGIIEQVEQATSLSTIVNIKKLKGFSTAYRIRSGDYRIGIYIENNIVKFARIAHRKDIYKVFP
ncbi:MAG: type II toxin-antitoxin system RelE/ParE family toxin [Mucilaginibacter sp.]|nr:type II toxin-antitoxin system RelE/ParE family toxin [Mucilaginibacter sp.]